MKKSFQLPRKKSVKVYGFAETAATSFETPTGGNTTTGGTTNDPTTTSTLTSTYIMAH